MIVNGNDRYMRVKDLKKIISDLPDDMIVVVPVIDEYNINKIYRFKKARTAGILTCDHEFEREASCINSADDGCDIFYQVISSPKEVTDVTVRSVLYYPSGFWNDESQENTN